MPRYPVTPAPALAPAPASAQHRRVQQEFSQTPGARGRIGVIQPAPGVMLEHEWPQLLPPGLLFPVARVRLTGGTAADYAALAAAAPAAAADLASAAAGVIVFACAIGSLYAGAAAEAALAERLAAAAGRPALTLAASSVRALHHVGARRIAILTPYAPDVNALVAAYATSQGLGVAGFIAAGAPIASVGDIGPAGVAAIAAAGLRDLADADALKIDALWIPCTAIQTVAAIPAIEAATRVPVISGSQALLWDALRTLAIGDAIADGGRLFG